jgi:outer membrane biosynthesis protein TonB
MSLLPPPDVFRPVVSDESPNSEVPSPGCESEFDALSLHSPSATFELTAQLEDLAASLGPTYRDLDSARFRERLADGGSPERQFFELLGMECPMPPQPVDPGQAATFEEVQRRLVRDGRISALRFCVDSEMWPVALVLARSVSAAEFTRICQLYVERTFVNDSFLSACIAPAAPSASWRSVLANALLNADAQSPRVLERKSGTLNARGGQGIVAPFVGAPPPPTPQPEPRPKEEPPERKPEPKPEPKPTPKTPDAKTNDDQPKRGWLGTMFGWMRPKGGKSKVVDLSDHNTGEMVWNGTRYVMKGQENEPEPPPLPPPPPKARVVQEAQPPVADNPPPVDMAAPPMGPPAGVGPPPPVPAGARVGTRTRASGKYVNVF